MSYQANYTRGGWKCICESCGRIVKAGELRQRWDGFMVDERCWEPRQPQDFVRGVADYQAPPFTRPEQADVFIPVTIVYDPYGESLINPLTLISTNTLLLMILPSPLKTLKAVNGGSLLLNNTTLG